jgi:hypothetical protein
LGWVSLAITAPLKPFDKNLDKVSGPCFPGNLSFHFSCTYAASIRKSDRTSAAQLAKFIKYTLFFLQLHEESGCFIRHAREGGCVVIQKIA